MAILRVLLRLLYLIVALASSSFAALLWLGNRIDFLSSGERMPAPLFDVMTISLSGVLALVALAFAIRLPQSNAARFALVAFTLLVGLTIWTTFHVPNTRYIFG